MKLQLITTRRLVPVSKHESDELPKGLMEAALPFRQSTEEELYRIADTMCFVWCTVVQDGHDLKITSIGPVLIKKYPADDDPLVAVFSSE